MLCEGGVLAMPFNMTVETRGLLEVDNDNFASNSLLSQQLVNHSRTLHCTREVRSHSRQIIPIITTMKMVVISMSWY